MTIYRRYAQECSSLCSRTTLVLYLVKLLTARVNKGEMVRPMWHWQCLKLVINTYCLQHPSSTSMSPRNRHHGVIMLILLSKPYPPLIYDEPCGAVFKSNTNKMRPICSDQWSSMIYGPPNYGPQVMVNKMILIKSKRYINNFVKLCKYRYFCHGALFNPKLAPVIYKKQLLCFTLKLFVTEWCCFILFHALYKVGRFDWTSVIIFLILDSF